MLPLCLDREGWRWTQGLFVQSRQQTARGNRGRLRKAGRGFKEAVVHLQVSPLGLTRCERLPKCYKLSQLGKYRLYGKSWTCHMNKRRGWIGVKRDTVQCCKEVTELMLVGFLSLEIRCESWGEKKQVHHLKRTTTSQGGFLSVYLITYLCHSLVICSLLRILSTKII